MFYSYITRHYSVLHIIRTLLIKNPLYFKAFKQDSHHLVGTRLSTSIWGFTEKFTESIAGIQGRPRDILRELEGGACVGYLLSRLYGM